MSEVQQPEGYNQEEEYRHMVEHIKLTIDNSQVHTADWEFHEGKQLKLTITLTPNEGY